MKLIYHSIHRLLNKAGITCLIISASQFSFINAQTKSGGEAVMNKIHIIAQPFELSEVQLLDSPFKHAMELDGKYLLSLDPDRLLRDYRKDAGLKPKGESYGGWEKEGIAGHTLGHYLSACSMMYASTGDKRFKDRVTYIVDELDTCQRANGNGYVAGIPNGKKIFAEVAAGDIRAQPFDLNGGWVPWYNLHKLFAGLLDANHYCNNSIALRVAVKLADWAYNETKNLTEKQVQKMLACEQGGMNEAMAELYARTGIKKYLKLAYLFHMNAVLNPLSMREDILSGIHSNTQIPKIIGLARIYELTGDTSAYTAAEFFWDRVVNHHSYVIGGNGDYEYFGPADSLSNFLDDNTCETCCTYNMLKLTIHLFSWNPTTEFADYYERALYNDILASQNPEDGMFCYYVSLRPGSHRTFSTPYNSFWCCVGTGMENHSKYGGSIYFHNDDSLWVNLFIASDLNWTEKGLSLKQETNYPFENSSSFIFNCKKPMEMSILFRYPSWAKEGMNILVNGKEQKITSGPGSYIEVRRVWQSGDKVEVKIPMSLHLAAMPDDHNRVAVMYGPIVLAGELGTDNDPDANKFGYVPVMITDNKPIDEWIKPVDIKQLEFRTVGAGTPKDVTLYPFYKLFDKRYSVYWDIFTKDEWSRKKEEYEAEQERLRKIEAATIDFVQPGDSLLEKGHNLQGKNMDSGEAFDSQWRHAYDGGWFSYDMKVIADKQMALVCKYWGGDGGGRSFDILVDSVKVGTQSLTKSQPGRFFYATYLIPNGLTNGKEKVTVMFEPHKGDIAGGVFGVRMVEANKIDKR